MTRPDIQGEPELQRILWACYQWWRTCRAFSPDPLIWYGWVAPEYEARFGRRFHQSRLHDLANAGLLEKSLSSRRRHRRYYKLPNPDEVERLLHALHLN
jgi:hypothetical protein